MDQKPCETRGVKVLELKEKEERRFGVAELGCKSFEAKGGGEEGGCKR